MNTLKKGVVFCGPGSLLRRAVLAIAMVICAGCNHYGGLSQEEYQDEFTDCGGASNGLGVMVKSARPKQSTCPGAVRVANEYLHAITGTDGKSRVDVQVDGAVWTCRERRGDTNPFTECVMQAEPHDIVILVS